MLLMLVRRRSGMGGCGNVSLLAAFGDRLDGWSGSPHGEQQGVGFGGL